MARGTLFHCGGLFDRRWRRGQDAEGAALLAHSGAGFAPLSPKPSSIASPPQQLGTLVMVTSRTAIFAAAEHLTHQEACRLAKLAKASDSAMVALDLNKVRDASMPGFARLVLLRRELLRLGRDLRIRGLQHQPAHLFEVHRLSGVLPPLIESTPLRSPSSATQR